MPILPRILPDNKERAVVSIFNANEPEISICGLSILLL